MTPEQQRAVALARAKAKARARGAGKTYTQFQSFNEGIGEGVYLSARDEAEGGAAVRRRLGGGGLDQIAKSIPFGEIPLAVFDAAGGFVQDLAPGLYGGGVQKVYEDARDERRTIQKVAAADNPLSYGGGQILGSTVTLAPVGGAGARSSAMVADDLLREGAKLTTKAAAAKSAPRAAALTAKATAKTARAAQLAKPAATIGEFTARASRIAGESAAKGVGYGAGIGGGLGFTAGEGDVGDRLTTASDAAVVGGIAGGVLGPVIQGLAPLIGGIAYKITTPKEVKGLDMVIKRMQRSGTTPEGIKAQFDLWNKTGEVPETLAEFMGPNERSLLSALITVNRETREQATNIFVNRGREEVNRLEDAFAGSFGAKRGDYAAAQTQAAKARVEDPEPFYKTAHFEKDGSLKPLSPEKMSALNNILADEDDIVRIAKDATADLNRMGNKSPAHKAARDEVRMYAEALQAARRGERVQVPQLSVLAADYIERAINQSYKAAGGGSGEISGSIAGWKALRNSVRDVIDDTGIGEARATSAERTRRGELLKEGLNIMKTSVDVDDVNRIMTGIPDAGIPAASEAGRRAYGVGASRAVANELRNVPNMAGFADATRKVARTPALREKLEAARPKVLTKSGAENKGSKQTKANAALDQAIERASDRAQFGVDMVGNSRTAFRQGDVTDAVMDDAMSQQAGEVIGDLLISGVGGVTQRLQDRLGRVIGNRIGQPSIYRPQINRAAANILLATGEQIPIQIARIAKRAAERANGRSRALPIAPPAGGATPPGAPTPPPTGGTPAANAFAQPAPVRASGFTGLRTDAGNAAVGAGVGALGPADSNEERLRNMAIGAGVMGVGGRVSRTVGARNALADTASAGFRGQSRGPNAGRFRFGPTGKAFNPYNAQVQDEIIRTSGGLVDQRNIDDLVSTYMDDLVDSTPQQIVNDLRSDAAMNMQTGGIQMTQRDVEYVAFAELMARQLTPMRKGADDILTAGFGAGAPKTTQQAARFETFGSPEYEAAVAKGLDMSQAGRMGRAREMGYDTDTVFFHGTATDGPIQSFRSGKRGDSPHMEHETPAIFFSDDPNTAQKYARSTAENMRARKSSDLFDAGKDVEANALYNDTIDGRQFEDAALAMLPPDVRRIVGSSIRSKGIDSTNRKAFEELLGKDKAKEFFRLVDLSQNSNVALPSGQQIYPVYLPSGMREVDANIFGGQFDEVIYDALLKESKEAGYKGLIIRNVIDSPTGYGDPSTVAAIFDPANIRSTSAAFDPDKAASPILTAGFSGFPSGPRKPSAPKTNAFAPKPGKLGTRTADAAAIATLGLQAGTAEADTGGVSPELKTANERVNTATKRIETADNELARLREEVLLLERVAAEEPPVPLVPTAEGKRVQRILAARNFDLGPNGVDGRVGGDTRKALAGNIAAIKSDIAKTEAERESALKEAADARNAEKQAQYLQMQRDAEPSGSQGLLVGGAALGAAIAGAMLAKGGRFRNVNFGRYGSQIKSAAKAAATTRKVNKLINTGKITSAQSGANSINQRAANVNTIAQIGGAGRRVPFEENAAGVLQERSRKNMFGNTVRPMETSELFKPQRFNANDAYAFGVAGLDVAITEGGIRHLKSEIKAAEAEMERAKNADDRQAFYAALKEKQSNEGLLVFAQIAQKVGMGYIGGRAISGIKPYSAPTPDLAGIRAERTLILQAINKPPPKPKKPAGTKPNP